MMQPPHALRVEQLDSPLGIDVAAPRLSWKLPVPTARQEAYRLRVGGWDSGWVQSSTSVLVPYEGPGFGSRERVEWRVQVETELGTSPWSDAGWWETGLLSADDWSARWIEPAEGEDRAPAGQRPAYVLRTTFSSGGPQSRARIYATAHGIYELFLNGERVGDQEL